MLPWLTGDGDRTLRFREAGREGSDKDDKDVLMSELGPMIAGCKNPPEAAKYTTRTAPYIQHPAAEIAVLTRLRLYRACITTKILLARGRFREAISRRIALIGSRRMQVDLAKQAVLFMVNA